MGFGLAAVNIRSGDGFPATTTAKKAARMTSNCGARFRVANAGPGLEMIFRHNSNHSAAANSILFPQIWVRRSITFTAPLSHLIGQMAGGPLHLWNEWSIQILVVLSFTLQVVLLTFAGMRRRNISRIPRLLLWLAYLLADSTAIYTLGHISNRKSPELRLAAFWAPFLLLHLGGQDTMTAYALQDNQLWLRHLLTLVLQALGAAYVLYRHIAGSGTLVTAAVLIFLVGIVKYGERVWTLKSSSHDGITNFLDSVEMSQQERRLSNDDAVAVVGDAEVVLQEAHELLYVCMGQFVDYKVWPSAYQQETIKSFRKKGSLFELIGMQLSIMHDIFYTKTMVIHTWYGCCIRAASLLTTATAFLLFRFKTDKAGYRRADVAITYTLLIGALVLEITSVLRAIGSSWTCAFLRTGRWDGLCSTVLFLRRLFNLAECGRGWSESIGQHNLLDLCTMKHGLISRIARSTGLDNWLNKFRNMDTSVISGDTKQLVLEELQRIVEACQGKEDTMWAYRGQYALKQWVGFYEDPNWCTDIDFDESILAWHFATNIFLFAKMKSSKGLAGAIRVLSNYMMFLLAEHPYMLPSPVRGRHYAMASKWLLNPNRSGDRLQEIVNRIQIGQYDNFPPVLVRGATLATMLLRDPRSMEDLPRVILGVWVEMLCYAASHSSRDSHARQLNSGAEFITVVWILASAVFNSFYCEHAWFKAAANGFVQARYPTKPGTSAMNMVVTPWII